MSGAIGAAVDRTAVLLLCLTVVILSALHLGQAAQSGGRLELAARIERGAPVDGDRVAREADAMFAASADSCGEVSKRADIVIARRYLAMQNQATDFDAWSNAAVGSDRLLRRRLRCSPYDGPLWAALALVERNIVVAPRHLADLLRFSQRTAPAEIGAIKTRFSLWLRGGEALFDLARDTAGRDIDQVLNRANTRDVARLLGAPTATMKHEIDRSASLLPEARRDVLRKRKVFDQPVKPPTRPLYQPPSEAPH